MRINNTSKDNLRQSALANRRKLTASDLEKHAVTLAKTALALPEVQKARVIALYESISTEPPTHALIKALRASGKTVIVPKNAHEKVKVEWTGDASKADVWLIPALLVDKTGTRLGKGAGWYDRALASKKRNAKVFALIYDFELVNFPLPSDTKDAKVDGAVVVNNE
ncbi:MAG: hypothetical protein LBL41_04030 [Bifidobacteriaceae bacterium]|jgi:5-formyltetrahydrofolate cyclo-ligase|nr:hypothetical protein [Bifidobacteriaceae bacterium]